MFSLDCLINIYQYFLICFLYARHFPGTGDTEVNWVQPLPPSYSLWMEEQVCAIARCTAGEKIWEGPEASSRPSRMLGLLLQRSPTPFPCPF